MLEMMHVGDDSQEAVKPFVSLLPRFHRSRSWSRFLPSSPRLSRCAREGEVVGKVFFGKNVVHLSPLRRERRRRNILTWTKTTRSGARTLRDDSVACAVAVRVVDDVGAEEDDAEA